MMPDLEITDRQAHDLLEHQILQFINESIGKRLTPEQWEREFERWMSRNPLQVEWERERLWLAAVERMGT